MWLEAEFPSDHCALFSAVGLLNCHHRQLQADPGGLGLSTLSIKD